jgi:DNA-directed RNA polymerase specialized sigma24 family protein
VLGPAAAASGPGGVEPIGRGVDVTSTDAVSSEASGSGDWPRSHLEAADVAFARLTCEPDPLSLDCDALAADALAADALGDGAAGERLGLPRGRVPLAALRDWLLAHPGHYAAKDAVWRELIGRARDAGGVWVIGAVGMAMPALVRAAGRLAGGFAGDVADLDGEILAGFLEALRGRRRIDVTSPAPYAKLCLAAWRAGLAAWRAARAEVLVGDMDRPAGPSGPHLPYGHPDLLIERAQAIGLLDGAEAEAFIDIRLGHRPVEPVAARLGLAVDTLRRRLARADRRLVEALAAGMLTGPLSPQAAGQLHRAARRRAGTRAGRAARRHGTGRSTGSPEHIAHTADSSKPADR